MILAFRSGSFQSVNTWLLIPSTRGTMTEITVPDDFELPEDWWQTFDSIETLIKLFRQYVVGLLIGGYYEKEFMKGVYSGFLTWYKGQLFWNTAGHVIDEIATALASPKFQVQVRRWMDNYEVGGTPAGPLHYPKIQMKSWKDIGIDYGVIAVEGLDAISLIESKQTRVWDLDIWQPPTSIPDGYYAIGFPGEWTKFQSEHLAESKVALNLQADLACLPIRKIERPADTRGSDFWDDPDTFNGEILPIPDRSDLIIGNVEGMSGGPVFSIQSWPDKRFKYRLIGIQHTWDPNTRIISAAPIEKIMRLLDAWLGDVEQANYV